MNKLIKIFVFMFTLSIIFTACKKDNELIEQKEYIPIEQKILSFIENMENGNKSGETMSIDSAVWYIEAALNYVYCEIDTLNVIEIDSTFYPLLYLQNDQIVFSEIISIYNEFENNLTQIVNNANGTNKKMLISDIAFIQEDNIKSTGNYFKLTTIVTGDSPDGYFEFDLTDFWYPVEGDGKCFIYTGNEIGKDASTQFELYNNRSIIKPYGSYSYATDIIITYCSSTNYFWGGDRVDCLNPDVMNYWLQKGKDFAALLNISIPEHSIINYDYFYTYYPTGDHYQHKAYYSFGIWRDARTIEL